VKGLSQRGLRRRVPVFTRAIKAAFLLRSRDDKIVILTGAGISAESGLGTFRDEGELWSQYRIEDVATLQGFDRDPAHLTLARLQRKWPSEVVIATQNVDALHEAGADLYAAIGTSGQRYPAASLVQEAAAVGAHTVELNLEPSKTVSDFAETRFGPTSQIVPVWVDGLMSRH